MADFNSKYTGEEVEQLLDQVANGNAGGGGGGGITIETDPVFSASPAATITEEKITVWNDAADLVGPLDQDIAQLYSDLANKQDAITDLETIREGAAKGATAVQSKDVAGIVTEEGFVAAEDLAKVATSGSYNDLVDKPTIPSAVTESTVSGWGFTKNTGTYSKPSGGIPASDLASDVNDALRKAEQYTGTVTGIKLNGETLGANAGVVDLGVLLQGEISGNTTAVNIQGFINDNLYVLPNAANGDEDDILLSRDSVKTINGQSIFGSGNITIEGGGSGEDIRYFADFTVETLKERAAIGLTISDDATPLIDAARSNKLICIPYENYEKGYAIANYMFKDGVDKALCLNFWIEEGGVLYYAFVAYTFDSYVIRGDTIKHIAATVSHIDVADDGVAFIETYDNAIYVINGPVSYLGVYPNADLLIGSSISFKSADYCSIETYDVLWANGVAPTIEPNTWHKLSLTNTNDMFILAVLTPFKPA